MLRVQVFQVIRMSEVSSETVTVQVLRTAILKEQLPADTIVSVLS